MSSLSPSDTYKNLPLAADVAAADIGFARWHEAAAEIAEPQLAAFMRDLAADETGKRLLAALFGNSPFLTHCCLREPALLMRLWHEGHEATFAELIAGLNRPVAGDRDRDALMADLRRAKRRAALLIAIADIAGLWPVAQVTAALTSLAEAALSIAARHLLGAASHLGDIELADPADPARGSGFIVLGVGKLGAGELNYSSDIDLILLYDAERTRYRGRRGVQAFYTQLAHELVRMMEERTAEGYVFRTDLRLRPDPGSTPPALSLQAANIYYEAAGQNWERAALIRCRPVAGDLEAGAAFMTGLQPFLWRKHLDFAAIQDIHSIKRQIHAQRGAGVIAVAGHNIKLGRGGIREIEFFAQTQLLIWGGRQRALRVSGTCEALDALAREGHITTEAATALSEAYRFLRRVEHRLQMVDDAQTHTIPADREGVRRLAVFLGYAAVEDFSLALTRRLELVESHYAALFEESPSLAAPGNLVFTGSDDDPDTQATLARLGFADPHAVAAIIRSWHHGRYRATRSQRARELLTELVPTLLREFGASSNPDTALVRFDHYMSRLPAGVQIFSLLFQNPGLLGLIAEIMGAAPKLAEALALRPGLIEGVLAGGFFNPLPTLPDLRADLAQLLDGARHYEDMLDLARRWVGERKFQLGVQLLRHRLDGEAAGAGFADIAEAAIAEILPRVTVEFSRAHGVVEGGELAVLALGKLGGREMTFASDVDLIIVYDVPAGSETSQGERPLPVATYYARLAQRFINALTVLTSEGQLYEVDMRLRPSGVAGPIASSFAAFQAYHRDSAWTWEHMALTRARIAAGSEMLHRRVAAAIDAVLAKPRDPVALAVEVTEMRRRIAEAHRNPPPFEVKHRRGGLVDIEFTAQFLQLRDAAAKPEVLHWNTQLALKALASAGSLTHTQAEILSAALALWRNVQGLLKLTVEEPFDENAASSALKAVLARGAGAIDFPRLKADMDAAATMALGVYRALVEAPARNVKNAEGTDP
jgi:glutamate-ammonia-ligase adenylyltransferase